MKKNKQTSFSDLVQIMKRLRGPNGCPWDREQTHLSLLKYLKEESAEVVAAIQKNDMENLSEELGDILLQILFHSQLAAEKGHFDIHDVLDTLKFKLVNRHPHVFGKNKKEKWTADDVRKRWKEIKAREKSLRKKRR
jgi:tetrapyrrole methylase family protein / MazG family protein